MKTPSAHASSVLVVTLTLLSLFTAHLGVYVSAQRSAKLPWVDEIVYSEEPDVVKAVERLIAGDIQVFLGGLRADAYEKAKVAGLKILYSRSGMVEITVNPCECRDGMFNPFVSQKIREALNYVIDREYVCSEVYRGLAIPRWTPLSPEFPEWVRNLDVVLEIQQKYKYNFEKGKQVIEEELKKLGVENVGGKWYYRGKPVTIKFLIPDTDPGKSLGDYVADQLEKIGFTVDRIYRTTREILAIVARPDPWACEWNLFVGGWGMGSWREEPWFAYWYTDMAPADYRVAFKPPIISEEFYEIARRIANTEYGSLEERSNLFRKATIYAVESGLRIWVAHTITPWAMAPNVDVIFNLGRGISFWEYAYGFRYTDRIGGTIKTAQATIFTRPVNPIAGAYTLAENAIMLPTVESAFYSDPFTDLAIPYKIKKAEVYAVKGTPIAKSSDWVELTFVDEIVVPENAWWGWDPVAQEPITVSEYLKQANLAKLVARVKVVQYYNDDIYRKSKWHDGSRLTPADFLIYWPLQFERADPSSPLYDESYVPTFESWRETFKGMRIVSLDPLIVEWYIDTFSLDAEWTAAYHPQNAWEWWTTAWPTVGWHAFAVGIRAEIEGKAAFSAAKADKMKVEWMNYWHGPTVSILREALSKIVSERWVPWLKFLRKYAGLTDEEITERWTNLRKFHESYGHFWIGTGPFFLYKTDPVAKIAVIRAFPEYPEPPEKWAPYMGLPTIPELKASILTQIAQGGSYTIDVYLTCGGRPCPLEDIEEVKWYIFHEEGRVFGVAKPVSDGFFKIELTSDITSKLAVGPIDILIFGIAKNVAIPASGKYVSFVTPAPMTTPLTTPPPVTPAPTVTITRPMTVTHTYALTTSVTVTSTVVDPVTTTVVGIALLVIGIALGRLVIRRK